MMKPFYTYETGIQLWESAPSSRINSHCATISVIHQTIGDLHDLWTIIVSAIKNLYPRMLKWRSVGHPLDSCKVQEFKAVKQLKKNLTENDYLEKNINSNIYSYIKTESFKDFNLNSITQPKYTALLFFSSNFPDNQNIWITLKEFLISTLAQTFAAG